MSKPILVLNCGSSSIKYQMIDVENEELLAKGLVQRIATGTAGTIDHEVLADEQGEFHVDQELPDHETALATVFQLFRDHGPDLTATFAVAHRTVHGGDRFAAPTRIDNQVVKTLRELSPLAPLHNPPAIAGIQAARKLLPDVPHIAIFDTAFFVNLPAEAYTYHLAQVRLRRHLRVPQARPDEGPPDHLPPRQWRQYRRGPWRQGGGHHHGHDAPGRPGHGHP